MKYTPTTCPVSGFEMMTATPEGDMEISMLRVVADATKPYVWICSPEFDGHLSAKDEQNAFTLSIWRPADNHADALPAQWLFEVAQKGEEDEHGESVATVICEGKMGICSLQFGGVMLRLTEITSLHSDWGITYKDNYNPLIERKSP